MILRARGETSDELAGFVDAVRVFLDIPVHDALTVPDIDWPSYADRHKQQPWFVLAALLLAENNYRVLMHGIEGFSDGFAPTRPALAALGITPARNMAAATDDMDRTNFAYLGLENFLPKLENLFHLRPVLGVRTFVNTVARAINPFSATTQLIGMFHPNYRSVHGNVAQLCGQSHAAVFKGIGGEIQRNPLKTCRVYSVINGEIIETDWPPVIVAQSYDWRAEDLAPSRMAELWQGKLDLPVAEACITATVAVALVAMGKAGSPQDADQMALTLWQERNRNRFS
jgi:anthranilate phosphoribosyltransferase